MMREEKEFVDSRTDSTSNVLRGKGRKGRKVRGNQKRSGEGGKGREIMEK